jgi:site-specific DNA-methyltransferase (adenine-specific)
MIKIKPDPRNTNRHTESGMQLLEHSIDKAGVLESISIATDGTIISGHARKEIFDKKGMKAKEIELAPDEFAVIKTNIKPNSKEYYEAQILANTTANKNFNLDMDLINEIVEEFDIDVEEVGVEIVEDEETHLEAKEDDFNEAPPENPITVLGDLYEIGEHRLLCGDSTDSDQVAKLMDGSKADLLLTDPPYGLGIDGQKESKAKNPKHNRKAHEFREWDNERPEQSTFNLIMSFAYKSIIWGGNYFADLLPATRGWLYWSKGQDGLTMSDGELAWTSENKPLRSITVNRATLQGSVHPTQKPIQVINFCLEWADSPNLIFDPFLGSGSTMVAAHQLKRKCYGMELDCRYADVIVTRMVKLDPTLIIKRNGVVTKDFE